MARSGSLNRKRQIAAKRKSNPAKSGATEIHLGGSYYGRIVKDATGDFFTMVVYRSKGGPDDVAGDFNAKHYSTMKGAINALMKYKAKLGYATNPAKKTVSQKISQLVHEGYPQRQAVAVALNEQRAGKVKRNPTKSKYADFKYCVEAHRYGSVWLSMAYFAVKAQAQDYINALKKTHPSVTLRIKTHK
jgi:hypothetical protein